MRARKSAQWPSLCSKASPAGTGFFWKRRSATLRPTGIQRSYMKRLKGVVSMIFTCTVEVRFSQMRGGANIT